ncbi:chromosome replication/partitioning protein [Borreliella turdi]|uniref:chromosome replication/partitioning protein n=1 Tax=Borreliella turdi TaxID=57863 RepID=UPI001243D19B|nr:chromosome replication/partitioning protein [Borreliella turdi]
MSIKGKKEHKKEVIISDRGISFSLERNDIDKDLANYNDLKNQLKFNLKNEVNNIIKRMEILYEIKTRGLYRYDGFTSFDQFIRHFVIAKTQAYRYLKVYQKVLDGVVTIDRIKEIGFTNVFKQIKKQTKAHDLNDTNNKLGNSNNNFEIPIRILINDIDLYKFCKESNKRISFILESLYKENRIYFLELASKYESYRKEQKYKKRK